MQTKDIVIGVLAILVIGLVYIQFGDTLKPAVSSAEIAETALAYINNQLLPPGVEAEIKGDVSEENGLYKFEVSLNGQDFFSYVTKDGKLFFPEGIELGIELADVPTTTDGVTQTEDIEAVQQTDITLGNFVVYDNEVCLEEGKPSIYFFGSEGCSYCRWEHPVVEAVMEKFTDYIVFHNNMDTGEDRDVLLEYNSQGSIPTVVLGCKYSRVGSGERSGEETEINNLTALTCDLTGGMPADVCGEVQDLIDQINQ